jgi:hypothetical protein
MRLPELPPPSIFPLEMPRYPNLWFFVDIKLALREQYAYAIRYIVEILERRLQLTDSFYQDIRNHHLYHLLNNPGEGSDFQARIGPIQYFTDAERPERNHWHQLHARFYCSSVKNAASESTCIRVGRTEREFFVVPASVHYEVATEERLHPYEDSCPYCGITGEYDVPIDRNGQDYCLKIHDPLGIELILYGTIRNQRIQWENGEGVTSISDLRNECNCQFEEQHSESGEPHRLARVFFLDEMFELKSDS